jgi:chromate transporter
MTMDNSLTSPTAATDARPRISLPAIFWAYLQVGLTAFGFSMLQKLKTVVLERHWLSTEEVDEGLALVQLYPGPIMPDFTAYVGHKLRGVLGATMAILGFILPSFVLMVLLSAAYFAYGSLPWVHPLFLGLEALVVGTVFNVTIDFGQRSLKGRSEALIALAAFAALIFKANAVLIVLLALALGAAFIRPATGAKGQAAAAKKALPVPASPRQWAAIIAAVVVVLAGAGLALALHSDTGRLALGLFKIGAVAFGNGTTIIPLVQAEVVDAGHWLNLNQFADGIALGQITPGPFLITAAFAGYRVGGILGAALATFAIFSPSFAMTLVFTQVYGYLRDLKAVQGALNGVLASFVGLLAVVVLQLAGVAITGPATLALAAAAFVAVRFFKLDVLWVFLGGLALWGGLLALGIA